MQKRSRQSKPCLSPKGYWYCTLIVAGKKKQISLGIKGEANEAEAWIKFKEVLRKNKDGLALPTGWLNDTRSVCLLYWHHLRRNHSADRAKKAKMTLDLFCEKHGNKTPQRINSVDLEEWLERPEWGPSTRYLYGATIKAAFIYAAKAGRITANPFKNLKLPTIQARVRYLTEAQEENLLKVARGYCPDFADFVWLCLKTGARPISEVASVSCSDYEKFCDLHLGHWIFRKHKTAKTGKPRTVLLRQDVLEKCKELAAKNPQGALVRTKRGAAWDHDKTEDRWKRLRVKCKLHESYTVYCLRHTFAVRLLKGGATLADVSALMGNTIKVCQDHYGHLADETDHMKGKLALLG